MILLWEVCGWVLVVFWWFHEFIKWPTVLRWMPAASISIYSFGDEVFIYCTPGDAFEWKEHLTIQGLIYFSVGKMITLSFFYWIAHYVYMVKCCYTDWNLCSSYSNMRSILLCYTGKSNTVTLFVSKCCFGNISAYQNVL